MKHLWPILFFIGINACLSGNAKAQSLVLDWKTETNGKIVAGPIIDDDHIYFGNEKGQFYSLDQRKGEILWKVETGGNIQGKAVLSDNHVYFESANTFYALRKTDGQEVWRYSLDMDPEKFSYGGKDYLYKLDPFDDKRSTGTIYNGRLYYGTSDGQVIGLNTSTGMLEFSVYTEERAPVRSTPLIHEGLLYFGDWNGSVYCYNLNNESLVWQKNTYREKPYATFGGIASEFAIYEGKLLFGGRNPMLNVLWIKDGQKAWTYTDPDGGWLIGDPVLYKDTAYVGGSDNFAMLAFNASDGRLLWKTKRSKNIYSKPVVTDDWVIYGGGNSYNPRDKGEVVILDRTNGATIATYETDSSIFSAPTLTDKLQVVFGSVGGILYSIKLQD